MKLKYAATIIYNDGACTGAVVRADDQRDAWGKLFAALDGSTKNVRALQLAAVLTDGMEVK